jgi:acyl-CoA synthetase (AMP-forming)/AMP-acid ligase II
VTDTIPAVLHAAAATHPDRPAYVMDGERLTFAELHERVRNVARSLVDFGFEPGDPVAIWGPNSLEWVVAALATTYVGGIVVPLNSRYTAHEAAPLVHRSGARWVFVEDGFLGRNQWEELQAAADLPHVDTFFTMRDHATEARISLGSLADMHVPGVLDADVDALADAVSPSDVADVLFTSGTTGQPKGVVSSHWQTVGVARTWGELGGVSAEDRYLVVNPFFHSFGYKVGIVTGLVTGATLYPLATFDPEEVMGLIQDERITVLPGAPTIFSSLLAAPTRSSYDVSSLRLAVTGAAVVPVVLIERMRSELEIEQVVTAFGMTEAVVATMCRGDETAEVVASTCGRAVPGMETRIDEETGELLLRGHYVMGYYLDDEAATAEAIDADGWLHTGDVGTLDADGNLTITDRIKDMYICGGFNVYPAEVEQAIARIDGVVESAVVGVPDERLGEVGKAYVVRAGSVPSEEEVIAFCKERLANFKVPREVELVDALPRNLSGKVLKNELRASLVEEVAQRPSRNPEA